MLKLAYLRYIKISFQFVKSKNHLYTVHPSQSNPVVNKLADGKYFVTFEMQS